MATKKEKTMITKLRKHDNHKVTIHKCKETAVHYAALRCADCDKHIQWLSKEDYFAIMGTDINNNNYDNNKINDNKHVIISVDEADTSNELVLQTSFGRAKVKGETPDSKGVENSRTWWQRNGYKQPLRSTKLRKFLEGLQ